MPAAAATAPTHSVAKTSCRSLLKVFSTIELSEGFTEGSIGDFVDSEEVSKAEYTEANLSVNFGGEVLTRITHPCASVESDQLGHTLGKSFAKVSLSTLPEVNVLEQTGTSRGEEDLEADVSVYTVTLLVVFDLVKPEISSLDACRGSWLGVLRISHSTIRG